CERRLGDHTRASIPSRRNNSVWGKFLWPENPGIPNVTAQCLPRRKLIRIQVTSIQQLNIMKTEPAVYTCRVSTNSGFDRGHTVAKMQRWLVTILLTSPAAS
ncbi:hypothetical protein JG687_00018268, partial [Phytophthora cactorum]